MKIYTKTGDTGSTSLLGGTRVLKSDSRIEAYGTTDELNSYIGLLRDQEINIGRREILKEIQDRLFTIGSELASDNKKRNLKIPVLNDSDIEVLEKEIDTMNEHLSEMKNFILPGGHTVVSFGHIARSVCRRAERLTILLNENIPVDPLILKYLNRLSDYLFVLCRKMAQELKVEEISWKPRK